MLCDKSKRLECCKSPRSASVSDINNVLNNEKPAQNCNNVDLAVLLITLCCTKFQPLTTFVPVFGRMFRQFIGLVLKNEERFYTTLIAKHTTCNHESKLRTVLSMIHDVMSIIMSSSGDMELGSAIKTLLYFFKYRSVV